MTHEQTRFIFDTNTVGVENGAVRVDDIIETTNHFRCIDFVIDNAEVCLNESIIKRLHALLKLVPRIVTRNGLLWGSTSVCQMRLVAMT